MKIEELTDSSIIVELSRDDMESLNITFDEMDYSDVDTRRVIWTILASARRRLGRELDTSGTLTVEAMPQKTGGCLLLFFTDASHVELPSARRRLLLRSKPFVICEFANSAALYAAAERLLLSGLLLSSELYSNGSEYRLLLSPCTQLTRDILCEYATRFSENPLACAHTREQWKCLAASGALEALFPEHQKHETGGDG